MAMSSESIGASGGAPGAGATAERSHRRHGVGSGAPTAVASKSKTAAVVLAVLFAFWTWLYTYKADAGKFWAGLILTLAGIPLALAYVGFPMLLAIWLWAVFDTASKSKAWFEAYPDVTVP